MAPVERDTRKPLTHRDGFVMSVCLVLAVILHYVAPQVGVFGLLFVIWSYVMVFIAGAIAAGVVLSWISLRRSKT